MQILKGPRRSVTAIAFSPDGRFLAVGHDRLLNLWDTQTGEKAVTWEPRGTTRALLFDPHSRLLAGSFFHFEAATNVGSWQLRVWSLAMPADPLLEPVNILAPLWFHPENFTLLVANVRDTLYRWDLRTRIGTEFSLDARADHVSGRWSRSLRGNHLHRLRTNWTMEQELSEFDLFDPSSGRLLRSYTVQLRYPKVGFLMPDDRHFVGIACSSLQVEDVTDGRVVLTRSTGRKFLSHFATTPTGDKVVAATCTREVQVWTSPEWPEPQVFSWPIGNVTCVAIAQDGQRAAAGGSSGQAIIWDLD